MGRVIGVLGVAVVGLLLSLGLVEPVAAACPPDSVESGTVCMDKYEASVWFVPPTQTTLIRKIQKGTVKLTNLTSAAAVAAGVVHLGLAVGDLFGAGCPRTGNGCVDVYAVSIPGVTPAANITWFQAAAAARNSLKRLATNQEWQAAALGTPDTGGADNGTTTCNTDDLAPGATAAGSRSGCVSDVGAFDMVGNLSEWVAEWVPLSTACLPALFGNGDDNCLAGASTVSGPGALLRGGTSFSGTDAGVFTVRGDFTLLFARGDIGFRAAR